MKLDLQHNELTEIPRCILELPSLTELILSHNHIVELPDIHEWSAGLTVLDLAFNELSNLPNTIVAPSIRTLNIGGNKFRFVPLCICSFTSLQYLDLSENVDILSLPVEMGRLSNLTKLGLVGLKDLSDPPRNVQRDARDCVHYLNSKLRSAKKFYRMKLMLVGKQDRGKTTLVTRLQGNEIVGPNQSTVGVDVSEWNYGGIGKRKFQFSIWDFGGQEEYYATHQCFLSERSMYLLLFNLKHGEKGVEELKPWLDNIVLRAPRSCVIIVGTHLDEVEDSERPQIDQLLNSVATLASSYGNKLQVPEVLPVGLVNRLENIGALREAIYLHASEFKARGNQPIMGQEIPASYFQLNKELEKIQQQVKENKSEPIMHAERFKDLVQQLKLPDIHSDGELRTATLFLNEVGTILHYDDRSHNLNELYFVDPRWLCDMMSKVVTVRERNNFVKNGILHSMYIPFLYRDKRFPWQYFEQYVTLLDRFEIALPLDNKRILIPSMLPIERPNDADLSSHPDGPYYMRYITFATTVPPGFWSRLISRIMHTVPEVCHAVDVKAAMSSDEEAMAYSYPGTPDKPGDLLMDSSEAVSPAGPQSPKPQSPLSTPSTPSTPGSQPTVHPPLVLPNISRIIHDEDFGDVNPEDIKLVYWREGLVYDGPTVSFAVESLTRSGHRSKSGRQGVLLKASPTGKGTKTICLLVDLVLALIHDWYPGLNESTFASGCGVEQCIPCYECLRENHSDPFEFEIEQSRLHISNNQMQIRCGYNKRDDSANHLVQLSDIVPDMLLRDLDAVFLLKNSEIKYQEDANSLLGEGGFGKVYRGKCRDKSVAIKKYIVNSSRLEDAFSELRAEALVLQKSHHPCLVCLVGVCVHPMMALVLEEAPMGSLEKYLIKKPIPISRVVIYRMAAQIAAALRFLHNTGYIFRDLKAANVLVWSLEPESLCHCKVTDFGIATHLSPVGALGIQGTKGFIAPEVLYIGKRKAVYTHKADIFSFAMLLYQMIARRHPFHNVQPVKIDTKVVSGERPNIVDVPFADTGYFFLTYLMKKCWEDRPELRPQTSDIINKVSGMVMQSVMAIHSVNSRFSVRRCCAITPSNYARANVGNHPSELWVCCDGAEGAEVNIYSTRMVKLNKNFIKDNQVQCMCVCGDHVWVGSRAGIEYGVIDIFSITSRELVHNIRMRENSVSCITCSDSTVYLGTLEGYCFAFCMDIKAIQSNARPRYKYISENAVDGIAVTNKHVWVSHTKLIYFLNLETLQMEHSWHRQGNQDEGNQDAFIGQLSCSNDGKIIWSAHLGGTILSAFDAHDETHLYDINIQQEFIRLVGKGIHSEYDIIMTAVTPALDTVFVGMATGHIVVFHEQLVMMIARPYTEYVRFLCPILSEGPCQTEKCMVLAGAKGFTSPLPEYDVVLSTADSEEEKGHQSAGVLVMFEAYPGPMIKQMKCLEDDEGGYLSSHTNLARMIRSQHFKDATHILDLAGKSETLRPVLQKTTKDFEESGIRHSMLTSSIAGSLPSTPIKQSNENFEEKKISPLPSSTEIDGQPPCNKEEIIKELESPPRPRARTNTVIQETMDVEVQGQAVRISCPKPATMSEVMRELAINTSKETTQNHCLGYRALDSGMMIKVLADDELQQYLKMESRPSLTLILK